MRIVNKRLRSYGVPFRGEVHDSGPDWLMKEIKRKRNNQSIANTMIRRRGIMILILTEHLNEYNKNNKIKFFIDKDPFLWVG